MFVNGTQIIRFKAKDSEIIAIPLCLENISKDLPVNDMKKTGFYRYVYDFSADYDAIAVDDKEWHSIKCLDLLIIYFLQQSCLLVAMY